MGGRAEKPLPSPAGEPVTRGLSDSLNLSAARRRSPALAAAACLAVAALYATRGLVPSYPGYLAWASPARGRASWRAVARFGRPTTTPANAGAPRAGGGPPPPAAAQAGPLTSAAHAFAMPACNRSAPAGHKAVIVSAYFEVPTQKRTRCVEEGRRAERAGPGGAPASPQGPPSPSPPHTLSLSHTRAHTHARPLTPLPSPASPPPLLL